MEQMDGITTKQILATVSEAYQSAERLLGKGRSREAGHLLPAQQHLGHSLREVAGSE